MDAAQRLVESAGAKGLFQAGAARQHPFGAAGQGRKVLEQGDGLGGEIDPVGLAGLGVFGRDLPLAFGQIRILPAGVQ